MNGSFPRLAYLPRLTAGLIEETPREYGRIVLVGTAIDRVLAQECVLDILFVDALGVWVCEEQSMPLHLILLDLVVKSLHKAGAIVQCQAIFSRKTCLR